MKTYVKTKVFMELVVNSNKLDNMIKKDLIGKEIRVYKHNNRFKLVNYKFSYN